MCPQGDVTIIPLQRKLRMPLGHIRLYTPLNYQAKIRVTMLSGLLILITKGELCHYYTMGVRESMPGIQNIP